MTKTFALPLSALLLAVSAAAAPAATPYDGVWDIRVTTQAGGCDATYRLPVKIENGAMRYVGDRPFRVSGQIGASGTVNVSIVLGHSMSGGAGRLTARAGSGNWAGAGPGATCSGRWQARRVS